MADGRRKGNTRRVELRPKSKSELGESQKVKLKACIEVSVRTAKDLQHFGRYVDIVDLAYYINMRENETIDYDVVKEVCEEYVKEKNINAFV